MKNPSPDDIRWFEERHKDKVIRRGGSSEPAPGHTQYRIHKAFTPEELARTIQKIGLPTMRPQHMTFSTVGEAVRYFKPRGPAWLTYWLEQREHNRAVGPIHMIPPKPDTPEPENYRASRLKAEFDELLPWLPFTLEGVRF